MRQSLFADNLDDVVVQVAAELNLRILAAHLRDLKRQSQAQLNLSRRRDCRADAAEGWEGSFVIQRACEDR